MLPRQPSVRVYRVAVALRRNIVQAQEERLEHRWIVAVDQTLDHHIDRVTWEPWSNLFPSPQHKAARFKLDARNSLDAYLPLGSQPRLVAKDDALPTMTSSCLRPLTLCS